MLFQYTVSGVCKADLCFFVRKRDGTADKIDIFLGFGIVDLSRTHDDCANLSLIVQLAANRRNLGRKKMSR